MNDKEFSELEFLIEDKLNELDSLQEIYRRETGRHFVRELKLNYMDNPCFEREVQNRPIWARRG